MRDDSPQAPQPSRDAESPREPMPRSFRPAWIFMGLMAGVTALMGLAAAIVALLVNQQG